MIEYYLEWLSYEWWHFNHMGDWFLLTWDEWADRYLTDAEVISQWR